MDVLEAIYSRRSIRSFKKKQVEEEKIIKILEAAIWAPSSHNSQPWEFIIIKNQETLKKIANETKWGNFIADAPLAIAIITDPEKSRWHEIDGALATQNIQLTAWALGLGTCWIGTMNREKVKQILNIPKEKNLLTVLPIGYPASIGKSNRKPLKDFIHYEKY
ncbi:MAG: nitroreductase family protein [Nitrososphaerota archaeon]